MAKGPASHVKLGPITSGPAVHPAEKIANAFATNMHPSLGKDLHDYYEYERETSAIPKVLKSEV